MRKRCPYCGKGVNTGSSVSRIEVGKDMYHFACYEMVKAGFKPETSE